MATQKQDQTKVGPRYCADHAGEVFYYKGFRATAVNETQGKNDPRAAAISKGWTPSNVRRVIIAPDKVYVQKHVGNLGSGVGSPEVRLAPLSFLKCAADEAYVSMASLVCQGGSGNSGNFNLRVFSKMEELIFCIRGNVNNEDAASAIRTYVGAETKKQQGNMQQAQAMQQNPAAAKGVKPTPFDTFAVGVQNKAMLYRLPLGEFAVNSALKAAIRNGSFGAKGLNNREYQFGMLAPITGQIAEVLSGSHRRMYAVIIFDGTYEELGALAGGHAHNVGEDFHYADLLLKKPELRAKMHVVGCHANNAFPLDATRNAVRQAQQKKTNANQSVLSGMQQGTKVNDGKGKDKPWYTATDLFPATYEVGDCSPSADVQVEGLEVSEQQLCLWMLEGKSAKEIADILTKRKRGTGEVNQKFAATVEKQVNAMASNLPNASGSGKAKYALWGRLHKVEVNCLAKAAEAEFAKEHASEMKAIEQKRAEVEKQVSVFNEVADCCASLASAMSKPENLSWLGRNSGVIKPSAISLSGKSYTLCFADFPEGKGKEFADKIQKWGGTVVLAKQENEQQGKEKQLFNAFDKTMPSVKKAVADIYVSLMQLHSALFFDSTNAKALPMLTNSQLRIFKKEEANKIYVIQGVTDTDRYAKYHEPCKDIIKASQCLAYQIASVVITDSKLGKRGKPEGWGITKAVNTAPAEPKDKPAIPFPFGKKGG